MNTIGKTILIILGVAAVGTAGYFIFRKKKPDLLPGSGNISPEIPASATNPYVAPQDQKKNTGKAIAIGAGIATVGTALALFMKGKKEDKERKAKGIPITSTGINPQMVL